MHRRNSRNIIRSLVLGMMTCLSSCSGDREPVFSEFVDIPSSGWDAPLYCDFATARRDSAMFADSARRYDVILVVRHTEAYPFADLYLSLASVPEAELPSERRIVLAKEGGTRVGINAHGIYTVADTIAREIALPQLFNLKVSQAMRRDALEGIVNVGVVILPSLHRAK